MGRKAIYTVNEEYFTSITSKSQAYILGFIYADGSVRYSSGLRICIHQKDQEVLEFIKQEMNCNSPIKIINNNYASWGINRTAITNNLFKLGLKENKSKNNINLPTIPFMNDFIRGVFDGDGSIWHKGGSCYAADFTGGRNFLQGVASVLQNSGVETRKIRQRYKGNDNSCQLDITGSQNIINLYYFLDYENQFGLSRKKEKFIESIDSFKKYSSSLHKENGNWKKIEKLYKEGKSQKEIADIINIPYSSTRGCVQKMRKEGILN